MKFGFKSLILQFGIVGCISNYSVNAIQNQNEINEIIEGDEYNSFIEQKFQNNYQEENIENNVDKELKKLKEHAISLFPEYNSELSNKYYQKIYSNIVNNDITYDDKTGTDENIILIEQLLQIINYCEEQNVGNFHYYSKSSTIINEKFSNEYFESLYKKLIQIIRSDSLVNYIETQVNTHGEKDDFNYRQDCIDSVSDMNNLILSKMIFGNWNNNIDAYKTFLSLINNTYSSNIINLTEYKRIMKYIISYNTYALMSIIKKDEKTSDNIVNFFNNNKTIKEYYNDYAAAMRSIIDNSIRLCIEEYLHSNKNNISYLLNNIIRVLEIIDKSMHQIIEKLYENNTTDKDKIIKEFSLMNITRKFDFVSIVESQLNNYISEKSEYKSKLKALFKMLNNKSEIDKLTISESDFFTICYIYAIYDSKIKARNLEQKTNFNKIIAYLPDGVINLILNFCSDKAIVVSSDYAKYDNIVQNLKIRNDKLSNLNFLLSFDKQLRQEKNKITEQMKQNKDKSNNNNEIIGKKTYMDNNSDDDAKSEENKNKINYISDSENNSKSDNSSNEE